jgi:hypothetical protein
LQTPKWNFQNPKWNQHMSPSKEKSLQKVVELLDTPKDTPKQSRYGQNRGGPAGPPLHFHSHCWLVLERYTTCKANIPPLGS